MPMTANELADLRARYAQQCQKVAESIDRVQNAESSLRHAEQTLERDRAELRRLHATVAPAIETETLRLLGGRVDS